jgi:hypothetical protein
VKALALAVLLALAPSTAMAQSPPITMSGAAITASLTDTWPSSIGARSARRPDSTWLAGPRRRASQTSRAGFRMSGSPHAR